MQDLEIFTKALEILSPDERLQYIRTACGDDDQLFLRVAELVRLHEETKTQDFDEQVLATGVGERLFALLREQFYALSELDETDTSLSTENRELQQVLIGDYRLLESLGEGGFGQVFVAEQIAPVQRLVALKIIKPGMDSREIVTRFNTERQALALMDHPNIARVFDGGSTERGTPYFVMELVRGQPITAYCDSVDMSITDRLDLFLQTCLAISHAHQKGIIHRDIKPNNVMVTLLEQRPTVKVIDFGIAKSLNQSLTDSSVQTRFSQLIGTPAYMSPEQAVPGNKDVDTRSDVYSLGILLYELLVGEPPFPNCRFADVSLDQMRQIISNEEPARPSQKVDAHRISSDCTARIANIAARRGLELGKLQSILAKDLDWIVIKAIAKDPSERYPSVIDLAADVQRFMTGRAVEARPPSWTYQLSRFVRRKRRLVVTATLFLVTLILGTIVSMGLALKAMHQERVTHQQEQVATQQRHRAEQAEAKVTESLFESKLAFARLNLNSRRIGQQFKTWKAVTEAVQLAKQTGIWSKHRAELQSLATTALTRPDLELMETYDIEPEVARFLAYDNRFTKLARRVRREGRNAILVQTHQDGTSSSQVNTDMVVPIPFDTKSQFHDEIIPILSPDGRFLLFGAANHGCILWDLHEKRLLKTFSGAFGRFQACFAQDSSRVIVLRDASTNYSTAVIHRLPDFTLEREIEIVGGKCLAISSNGRLAVALGARINVYDVDTGELQGHLVTSNYPGPHVLSWSASGELLASARDNRVLVWDVQKLIPDNHTSLLTKGYPIVPPNPAETLPLSVLFGHHAPVDYLAFHPQHEFLLASSSWDDTTRLWNVFSGTEQLMVPQVKPVFSVDGRMSLCNYSQACDYRLSIGQACQWVDRDENTNVVFGRDNRWVAASSTDGARFWSLPSLRPLGRIGRTNTRCLVPSPSGKTDEVFLGNDLGIFQLPTEASDEVLRMGSSRQILSSSSSQFAAVVVSPDERWLAAIELEDWQLIVKDLRQNATQRIHRPRRIEHASFAPNSRWLAIAYGETLEVIDLLNNKTLNVQGTNQRLMGCAFSQDGRALLLSHRDSLQVLDVAAWTTTIECRHVMNANGFGWSSNGKLLGIPTRPEAIGLFNSDDYARVAELELADPPHVHWQLSFSPHDHYLAWATGKNLILWNIPELEARLSELDLQLGLAKGPINSRAQPELKRIEIIDGDLETLSRLQKQTHGLPQSQQAAVIQPTIDSGTVLPDVYAMRGASYASQGDLQSACADLQHAIELAPYCVVWEEQYADHLFRSSRFREAWLIYERLADPATYDRAVPAFRRLCRLAAAHPEAIRDREQFTTSLKKWLAAIDRGESDEVYRVAIENLGADQANSLRIAMALAIYELGDRPQALRLLNGSKYADGEINFVLADIYAHDEKTFTKAEAQWQIGLAAVNRFVHGVRTKFDLHFYDAMIARARQRIEKIRQQRLSSRTSAIEHSITQVPTVQATKVAEANSNRIEALTLTRAASVQRGHLELLPRAYRSVGFAQAGEADLANPKSSMLSWRVHQDQECLQLRLPVPDSGVYRLHADIAVRAEGDFEVTDAKGNYQTRLQANELRPGRLIVKPHQYIGEFEAVPWPDDVPQPEPVPLGVQPSAKWEVEPQFRTVRVKGEARLYIDEIEWERVPE